MRLPCSHGSSILVAATLGVIGGGWRGAFPHPAFGNPAGRLEIACLTMVNARCSPR